MSLLSRRIFGQQNAGIAARISRAALVPGALAVGFVLVISSALAQPATIAVAPKPATDSAQIDFQRQAQLSPQDELTEADRAVGKMESAAAGVRKQLEQSRKQRDVVKTLCLDDKLSQIDVAIRSARERKISLQAAAASKNIELSHHEFTVMQVLRQRGDQLVAEANQCIGEESAYTGESKVTVTVDPEVSRTEQGGYPSPDGPLGIKMVTDPPQCTSCTR